MTRSELIDRSRFEQSMRQITTDTSLRSPYGLSAVTGYLGDRDPQTGLNSFSDANGVTTPTRDIRTGAEPDGGLAAAVSVVNGQQYCR